MTGTILNVLTILVGSLIGISVGNRLPAKMQETIMTGLGLTTLVVGMQNALRTGNILVPLFSVLVGVVIGELLDVDGALKRFGGWLQTQVTRARPTGETSIEGANNTRIRFINAFMTASLVFCIGPLATLGPIQNGMNAADIKLLAIKSTLDFFASIAFASTLGIGVAFSILPTIVIQGGFALVGAAFVQVFAAGSQSLSGDNVYIRELTATGGLLLLGIALILLNLKQVRVANFLPALLVAPILVLVTSLLGISVYPPV